MASHIERRKFLATLGGAAVAWPLPARAQQATGKMRRIGVLMNLAADDPESMAGIGAFLHGLHQLGWVDGRNVVIHYRWGAGDNERIRKSAQELVALAPDVILAVGAITVSPLQQVSRNVPIVFATVTDPVGAGIVSNLARPGGNTTGFTNFEYGISAKWLELLKELVPSLRRAAVLRDPTIIASISQFASIQSIAPSLGVELSPIDTREASDIERSVSSFSREANSGLIVVAGTSAIMRRDLIIGLAARYRLPAVYPFPYYYASRGGLISYGPNMLDSYRHAAGYVDRVLKGEKPADLPVQQPTKYELVINLKTAKALGLEIPPSLLARADEVIE
jgi:putative ABC transport system substrate-binding protein